MSNKKLISWLDGEVSRLVYLDEPKEYVEEVARCRKDSSDDYYVGVYQGVMATIKALQKSLYGDTEELVRLICDTENENVCHWEEYEPVEDWELEE